MTRGVRALWWLVRLGVELTCDLVREARRKRRKR